ncbi:potassium voltage-gated channel subfamily h member 2-like [Plakobranchus ocellatus]|uniref:Potassium voltage-gated channel subfamily h member 2-like n=1 Tax=Plakobranchus ocellatus TaxID=259542 RepID=A0AAV3ZC90_9GAST|nr:potassium voltage-gated channel subfamily h member 2-like [Plakobranchus ocellatus]
MFILSRVRIQAFTPKSSITQLCLTWSGARFLCSVLVAPVKNETGDIIMFIINYEDITETASKNELRKFTNNRHRSFKLRLPSIRRDIRSRVKGGGSSPSGGERSPQQPSADPENPVLGEEAVPLNSMGQGGGAGGAGESVEETEARDAASAETSAGVFSRLHPAHGCIKEEEEGEGEEGGRSKGHDRDGRYGNGSSDSRRGNEGLLSSLRDVADVDRGEECYPRARSGGGGGGGGGPLPIGLDTVDNLNLGKKQRPVVQW